MTKWRYPQDFKAQPFKPKADQPGPVMTLKADRWHRKSIGIYEVKSNAHLIARHLWLKVMIFGVFPLDIAK